MKDDSAGILIFEKGGGGYVVVLQPPKGEEVEVFIASGENNSLYRMEKTDETATMDTFTGVGVRSKPKKESGDSTPKRKHPFEVVIDNG